MRQGLIAAVVAAFALSIFVAGCGGGDDSTAETLTKAQYLKQADAICAKTENRQLARMRGFNEPPGPESEEKLVRVAGLPPLNVQVKEISELEPPAEMEDEVAVYIAAFKSGIKETEADPSRLLDLEKNPFVKPQDLARKLGLKVCGGA